jgi:hypothetical protein
LNDATVFDSKELRWRPNLGPLRKDGIGEVEDLSPVDRMMAADEDPLRQRGEAEVTLP